MIGCYSKIPTHPKKSNTCDGQVYAGGVKNLLLLEKGKLIVGAGDGTVELTEIRKESTCAINKIKKPLIVPAIITVNICDF